MRTVRTLVWKRLDIPGLEYFQLIATSSGWILKGTVVLAHPRSPTSITYSIETDQAWQTREVLVKCTDVNAEHLVAARTNGQGRWWQHDEEVPAIHGCVDVDLGFSPSTNTLPIQRLQLAVGGSVQVKAAWLRFPELRWELLPQTYNRTAQQIYTYQSPGFSTVVEVDDLGLVRRYRGYWEAVHEEW
jgi:uncharacterized protein